MIKNCFTGEQKDRPPSPSIALLSSTAFSSCTIDSLPDDCLALVFACLPLYLVCSRVARTCKRWNIIACHAFGAELIRSWSGPSEIVPINGQNIYSIRCVCAAIGLVPSMEKCGLAVAKNELMQLLLVRISLCYRMHFDKRAEADVKVILSMWPDDPTGPMCLGDMYARAGRLKKAKKAYTKALKMDPQNQEALTKINEWGARQRLRRITNWTRSMATIKRVVLVCTVILFVVLFIVQGVRVF